MGFSLKKLGNFVGGAVKSAVQPLVRPAAAVLTLGASEVPQVRQATRWVDPTTKDGLQHAALVGVVAATVAGSIVTAGAAAGPGAAAIAAMTAGGALAKGVGAIAATDAKENAARAAAAQAAAAAKAVAAAPSAAIASKPPAPAGAPAVVAATAAQTAAYANAVNAMPGLASTTVAPPLTFLSWLKSLLHHG